MPLLILSFCQYGDFVIALPITLLRTGEGSQKCSGFCPCNKDNKFLPTFFIELLATFLQSEVRCRLMYHSISYYARLKSLYFRSKLFRLSSLIGERGLIAGRDFPLIRSINIRLFKKIKSDLTFSFFSRNFVKSLER